jgi:hypothetical protein
MLSLSFAIAADYPNYCANASMLSGMNPRCLPRLVASFRAIHIRFSGRIAIEDLRQHQRRQVGLEIDGDDRL